MVVNTKTLFTHHKHAQIHMSPHMINFQTDVARFEYFLVFHLSDYNFSFDSQICRAWLMLLHWTPRSGVVVNTRQPERHVLARAGHQHVFGVELHALHRAGVVAVEDAHLGAVLGVPDVDAAVGRARDDKLRVRREGGLQGKVFGVEMTGEGL